MDAQFGGPLPYMASSVTVIQGDEWLERRVERKRALVERICLLSLQLLSEKTASLARSEAVRDFPQALKAVLMFEENEVLEDLRLRRENEARAGAVAPPPPDYPRFDPLQMMAEQTERRDEMQAQIEAAEKMARDMPEPIKSYVEAQIVMLRRDLRGVEAYIKNLQRMAESQTIQE